ncbi:MAG: hypothetical protein J6Y24_07590 [Bacteroidales bacterium]|nr:hypothetical protein [Bacteroidales bacterium]
MTNKRFLLLLLLMLCLCLYSPLMAQDNLNIISKQTGNTIELRWAPCNLGAWRHGNEFGYKLERITIFRDGKQLIPVETVVLAHSMRLKPLSDWERREDEKYFAIAGECIFGEKDAVLSTSPVGIYKNYQQEQNRFGFSLYCADMNKEVAEYMGLYYADQTAKKNEKYSYRITFAMPDSLYCDTARTFGYLADMVVNTQPEKPDVFFDKKGVDVMWKNNYGNTFIGYYVERSFDNKNFERLNEEPIAVTKSSRKNNYYTDTTAIATQSVYYRIVGVDSFSDESVPSASSSILNTKPISQYAEITTANPLTEGVELNWKFDAENEPGQVDGFKIYRAHSAETISNCIATVTDVNQRRFVDRHPLPDNYYYISVFNSSEEKYNPYPYYCLTIDSIPPDPPAAPTGFCDSLGRVWLSWQNPDTLDVIGFRLLRKNSEGESFLMLAPNMLTDTYYVDTVNLNTLSRHIYYSLKSVDARGNQSELSPTLKVERYDIVAPQPSMITNIEQNKNGVAISWNASVSKDVASYALLRCTSSAEVFDTLTIMPGGNNLTYLDKTAEPGCEYYYKVLTLDAFGNHSASKLKAIEIPGQKESDWQLKNTKTLNSITLKWSNKDASKPVDKVLIYRKTDDKPLHYYTMVKDADQFEDKNLVMGKHYAYRIRVVYTDATETQLSNEVKTEM